MLYCVFKYFISVTGCNILSLKYLLPMGVIHLFISRTILEYCPFTLLGLTIFNCTNE